MHYYLVMFEDLLARSGLSFDRLRNFLLVAEAGSMVKASGGDPVRQSLFSRQIRELEEFFGTQLTQRQGKGIRISPAGQRLASLIREQLQGLADFQKEQHGAAKRFTFAAGASIVDWLLLPCIKELTSCLHGANLRLESHRSLALVEAVREGSLDFAMVREDAIPEHLPRAAVGRVSFWVCVGRDLITATNNGAKELRSDWHQMPLALPIGGSFRAALQEACEQSRISLKPAVECQSFLQMKQLVLAGTHVSILPSLGLSSLTPAGAVVYPFKPLKDYGRNLCLHWNQRQMARRGVETHQLEAMAKCLKRTFNAISKVVT